MSASNVSSDRTMSPLSPPTLWDLLHWIAVRDSALTGTIEGYKAAREMVKLWGPQREGMAAHPSLPALCVFVKERWGPKPPPARWCPWPGETWVGLDEKACLDLRDLVCRDLGLRPSEADRLPLSDVADHFCFRPIVPPTSSVATLPREQPDKDTPTRPEGGAQGVIGDQADVAEEMTKQSEGANGASATLGVPVNQTGGGELAGRQRSILETMAEHEVTGERRRKYRADIVKLINRTHKSASYSRDFSALVKLGYLGSLEGPRGGYWLTVTGKTEAQRLSII